MRIGVLTGGGDCPGLNAVIRAIVRKGVGQYGHEFVGYRDGWRGPLENDSRPLGVPEVRGILPRGGTILGSSRTNPFADEDGPERIAANLGAAGVDGLIVVDLPPEEDEELCLPALKAGLNFVLLATPTTDDKRLPAVLTNTSGFVYYVSRLGVTGAQRELSASLAEEVARVRAATKIPVAVGFGVSNGAQARSVAGLADGVIVGSAIVDCMAKAKSDSERVDSVRALVRELIAGVRG